MTSAQHSSKSNEHYTPEAVVTAARITMGGIDLDPATCATANGHVRATFGFTQQSDPPSLLRSWHGRVFLNPPGGKTAGKSNAKLWWQKLAAEWQAGRVTQAIFLGFTIEILQSTQVDSSGPIPLDFPFCIPSRRLDFLDENLQPQGSPTHANAIVYLPPRDLDCGALKGISPHHAGTYRFQDAFSPIGRVVVPR